MSRLHPNRLLRLSGGGLVTPDGACGVRPSTFHVKGPAWTGLVS